MSDGFTFSPGCNDCCRDCAEVLFAWFDCGDCCGPTEDCPEAETCYWWDQVLAGSFYLDGFGNYRTLVSNQLLIGPLTTPPGPVACIQLVGGEIKVASAGYVHMLPNSGSAVATINANAAYGWYYYNAGDTLACTYQMTACECNPPDLPITCTATRNDVVPPFNP